MIARLLLAFWCTGLMAAEVLPPDILARLRQVNDRVYRLDYRAAEAMCQQMIRDTPDDPVGYVYLARTYWSEELKNQQALSIDRFASSEFFSEAPLHKIRIDPALEAKFNEASRRAIDSGKARLRKDPSDLQSRYLLGLAYQNLASFESSLKRSWWSAFQYGNQTRRYHRDVLRQAPSFADARMTTGVYDYVAGSLSWKAKWLAFFLGYSGSKERGKAELERVAKTAALVGDDARTLLVLFYTRDQELTKARDRLVELRAKYPENYLLPLELAGLALRMKDFNQAAGIYQEVLRQIDSGPETYRRMEKASVYNRLGVAVREAGNLNGSREWLERAMSVAQSPRTRVVSQLELGKTLERLGRRQDALKYYEQVRSAEDFSGSRAEAERLAQGVRGG